MKRILTIVVAFFVSATVFAQESVATMRENARKEMQSKNLDNAVEILKKAYALEKDNIGVQKDLAMAYFYKNSFPDMLEISKTLLAGPDPDVQTYQLAGMAYKGVNDLKGAEKVYQDGLKEFPASGPLYSEYGELQELNKTPQSAIATWEKGIQVAPSFAGNYFNAAIYYFKQPEDRIWAIIYGEIYANMESLNPKSNMIKKMVFDAYQQKLFSANLTDEAAKSKNEFEKAILSTFAKQTGITAQSLDPEKLAMARTKFILDWFNSYDKKFPFKLFDYHRQLMQGGLFDSYNQWMFAPGYNMDAFKNWAELHKADYTKFTDFHTMRIFKMPQGQYYK